MGHHTGAQVVRGFAAPECFFRMKPARGGSISRWPNGLESISYDGKQRGLQGAASRQVEVIGTNSNLMRPWAKDETLAFEALEPSTQQVKTN
jgi:hypothetical protein